MKCPYRKETRQWHDGSTLVTDEYYMDCYEDDCPYFKRDNRMKSPMMCLRPYDPEE